MLAVDHFDFELLLQREVEQCNRLLRKDLLDVIGNAGVFQIEEPDVDNRVFELFQEI